MRVEQEQWGAVSALCGGDQDAARFIIDAWTFAMVYDDAIDGDKHADVYEIHSAFQWAVMGLHRNPFYLAHQDTLDAAFQTAMVDWLAANELEQSGDREKLATAYILRCSPYTLFTTVVLLAAGIEKAKEAAIYFRTLPYASDTIDGYIAEHTS